MIYFYNELVDEALKMIKDLHELKDVEKDIDKIKCAMSNLNTAYGMHKYNRI